MKTDEGEEIIVDVSECYGECAYGGYCLDMQEMYADRACYEARYASTTWYIIWLTFSTIVYLLFMYCHVKSLCNRKSRPSSPVQSK